MWRCSQCNYPNPNSLKKCFKCKASKQSATTPNTENVAPVSYIQQPIFRWKISTNEIKRISDLFGIVVGIGVFLLVLNIGGFFGVNRISSIEYRITGSASKAMVTYVDSSGGTSQLNDVSIPWSNVFTAKSGAYLYLSAQNQHDNGSITVSIVVDDKEVKSTTSSGAYVVAGTSHSL